MADRAYDWTEFSKQVFIDAPLADVFRLWATPEGITQWFIAEAIYRGPDGQRRPDEIVEAGDNYHWIWHQDLEMKGEALEVVENERISFTFGQSESRSEPIAVTVSFEAMADETLVRLTQSNMADTPADHAQWHLSCNLGWSFFMTNLKAWMEHGVDLREKDRERAYAARAVTH